MEEEFTDHRTGGGWKSVLRSQPAALILVFAGWSQFLNFFRFWLVRTVPFSYATCKSMEWFTNGLAFAVMALLAVYLRLNFSRFKEILPRQLAVVWVSWLLSMVATNLIIQHSLGHVVFELQHTLFMLYTGLAVLMTGILTRKPSIWKGGIFFVVLALSSTFFQLKYQMLMEAAGWLIGVAWPGYRLLRGKS